MKSISRMGLILGCAGLITSCTQTGQADLVSTQPNYQESTRLAEGGMGAGTGKDYANGPRTDQDNRRPKATPAPNLRQPAEENKLPDHSQMLKE